VRAFLTLACLLLASSAWGASLRVEWDAPTTKADGSPLDDLAGYRLYLESPCPSLGYANVTGTAVIVNDLAPSTTYTARVTAVNTAGGESECSAPASGTTVADGLPGGLVGVITLRWEYEAPPPPPPAFTAAPNPVTFNKTVGGGLPPAQTVTISGGTGTWTTQDSNPWADVTGGTWDGTVVNFAATATSFGIQPSGGMNALGAGTYTETITVRRGALVATVTVRVVVSP
jgi:hypothetical protein